MLKYTQKEAIILVTVRRKAQESNDNLINRFRNLVNDSGILLDMRNRDRHVKDAEKRKEKKKERERLIKQRERKNKR